MTATTTTTVHRPGCPRPGWVVEPARSIAGVSIARCTGCGAVEIRREPDR